jgi:predicted aldo/keto reductase-like oxidoreductase
MTIDPKHYLRTLEPPEYEPGTLLSEDEARELVRAFVEKNFNSFAAASRYYGRYRQYISQILQGRERITSQLAEDVGLERFTGYIKS